MIGFLKLILCFCVYLMVLNTAECQVTVTNLNGTGTFLCGHDIALQCAIPGYTGGMTWQLDGTLIAQCAFGSCTSLGALPSGDTFNADETAKIFNLTIGITHADNGTTYQCDDGTIHDQTTVNIQVPPSESAFTKKITETTTSITVEAGCFYPSDAGRMDVYYVTSNGTEMEVDNIDTIPMTPTTTGCTGDCAGPNIYTATGSITLNISNIGGNLKYRFKVYHINASQTEYVLSIDSSAIYKFGVTTTLPTTVAQTTSTFNTTGHSTSPPTSGPDCGRTCIIIIVVCVVVLFIIIIIVCCCIRRRKPKKDTKDEMNDTKQDQNNIPSRESDCNKINEKKQDQTMMEHKL